MLTTQEFQNLKSLIDIMFDRDLEDVLDFELSINADEWVMNNADFCSTFQIDFDSGSTRLCIFSELFRSWVIKIPLICSDIDLKDRIDYCKEELDHYNLAKEKGFEKYFPETYFLCEFGSGIVIVQERVNAGEDIEEEILELFIEDVSSGDDEEDVDYYERIEDYLDDKDKSYIVLGDDKFSMFLMDNDINDLHEGNWGQRNNGDYVILDFAGYSGYRKY